MYWMPFREIHDIQSSVKMHARAVMLTLPDYGLLLALVVPSVLRRVSIEPSDWEIV